MTFRKNAHAVWRFVSSPRVAIVVGILLMAGSAVVAVLTWPPTNGTVRPFTVGVLLVLRGIVLPPVRRWIGRKRASGRGGARRRPPHVRIRD